MDSMLGADATVPGTLGGCSGLARGSPDEVDGIGPGAGLGDAVLPDVSEETVSPTRARNMKDFENQITELKKENFNLKLRIYFLEERMQQEFDGPTEHIYKTNIELKVEVESLKRELQEREQLLIKASKAVESLAERGGSEVQRVKEDAQKKVQQVEDLLTKRIFHLEEDVKAAQAELEKAFAGTETEKALRLSLENKLSEMKKRHEGDVDMAVVLEQKDRLIEDLKLSLKSKEALIQCLKEEKSQLACPGERVSSGELRGLSAAPRGEQERGAEAAQMERQERHRLEERIQALQEDLREKEREIAAEKKNSLKRDKAIQGLTMALKSKEKEVEDLSREMEELSAALAKVTDAPQEAQTQKLQGSEDYEAALLEKVALLAQLHSENINKSAENHRLRRNIKKVTQELSDLQQERERLEKDLEEAHRDRGRGDHTIHDLRNEVEKLRNEVNEREKAMENRYKSLLSESNKKLHSQEQMIRSLRGSIDPEDLLLQEFSEKDSGAVQPTRPSQSGEELRARSGDSAAKCSLQRSPGSNRIFSEEKQQLDYEELLRVLKKERDIYAHLVKSLQDPDSINSLQAELNSIFALRKQLEQDVLSYRNLQKTLEEQISEIRRREEEPFSFYSDQTSYLSICLEEPNRFQVEHFSQEELKKKVSDLIQLVRELHADNQHLKKTMLDLSCMGAQGGDRLGSAAQSQVVEDFSKGGCKNGYSRHTDSSILDYDGAHTPGCPRDQSLEEGELLNLLAPFFNEKATLFLESRPDLLKVLRELLLERMRSLEQGVSAEHLDGKTEKSLTPVAVQLGGELGHLAHVDSSSKSRDDPRSPWTARLLRAGEAATRELKDASVQTVAAEGDTLRFTNQGKRGVWEEEPPDATFHAEGQPQSLCLVPGKPAAALSFPSGADKDAKKSRLPILIKPSRSLGNVYRLPATQEVVAQLQGQILELQGELKEFKICNKQLHQKLILAEAMMEERPAADKTLQEDAETRPPDGLAVLPTCQGNSEGFPGPAAVAACRSSKSPLSSTVRVFGAHPSENIDTSSDTENLKQKIRDLETELQGYRNFLFQLQKHSQCSEAIITVLCGTEGGQDVLSKPKGSADEEEMTFSSLHRVRYVKHMKILRQLAPEVADGGLLEGLRQQLLQQECELQKEQNLNMELFSEIHNLQNKFRDLSPSRYDSLVQSQARELSLQRQQIKESHGICVIYRQHMNATMKAFERLLRAGGVDHDVAEGFQEQLNQCAGLLEKLEKLFLSGKSVEVDVSPQTEVMERMEEDSSTYRHILPESPEPSASHALSDCEVSEKSSVLSRDQKQDSEPEKASVLANRFSQDLVMEHIQEIRSLRRRLEESIRTNEELRGQLERQGHEPDPGATNAFAYGSELHDSLTSEICFLRKQNQALNTMLAKGSRDKQKENEKLRESLSRKAASLELLQREYACVKGDNERLQSEVRERERHTQQLLREVCSSRSELSRAREEAQLRQQLLSQNEELLQSLRVELKVYERLDEEHHRPREVGAEACGEGCRGQDPSSDLRGLLTEIQALRGQLEKSIETSSALRSRLEEQLALEGKRAQEAALTVALQTLTVPEWPLHPDKHGGDGCPVAIDNSCDLFDSTLAVPPPSASETPPLSENDSDSLSCHSGVSATSTSCTSHPVPGHRLWASKSGCHVLGLTADYEALCQQIGRGQKLFAEMALQIQEAPRAASPELGTKGPHSVPLHTFVTSVGTAKLILEEAARLLTLFWRVSLPTNGQCTLHCGQTGEMKAEITKLHKKLFEQEKKLQNSLKLLQLSKHQEKVIFDQLVVTHKVLRKARGNLELRPGGAHPGTSSPSRPGS
ncbi:CDK5 regulatory subunit-associated protein 2 isoform X9 [Canis lupus dingo]|uniref:CDK5 regulatory subunit-associated protein 2 isoform X9 n=1 Tax=Canis lupus dingo TaxID=286419 RepID=UPI0020C37406|nr:CDK5 regulatory subunit-associated protein 2 isoform X9 [Canis lupus dingo]